MSTDGDAIKWRPPLRRTHLGAFVLAFASSLAGGDGSWTCRPPGGSKGADGRPSGWWPTRCGRKWRANAAQRRVLLSEAIDAAPDYLPARGKAARCSPAASGCRSKRRKPKRPPIRSVPNTVAPQVGATSLDGQLALARWCRKNGFDEEAKFHWRTVLAHQPNNEEALRALGVRWFGGRLMSHCRHRESQENPREPASGAKEFAPRVARWERMLSAGDLGRGTRRSAKSAPSQPAKRFRRWKRSRSTRSGDQRATSNDACRSAWRWCRRSTAMPTQEATKSLVRHALFSPTQSVRESAIAALERAAAPRLSCRMLLGAACDADRIVVPCRHRRRRQRPLLALAVSRGPPRRPVVRRPPVGDAARPARPDLRDDIDDRSRGEVDRSPFPATNPAVPAEMAAVASAESAAIRYVGGGRRTTDRSNQRATTDIANRTDCAAARRHDRPGFWR